MGGQEYRQTTSNIGHMGIKNPIAIAKGLHKYYYSIVINYRKSEIEQRMLLNLNKVNWASALKQKDYSEHANYSLEAMKNLNKLTKDYNKWI